MYHIPNDKRAERSAGKLCDGLLACLDEKQLIDVTVADVTRASGVSRATFYRLFDNTADILAWRCEGIVDESMERARQAEGMSHRSTFLFFGSTWLANRGLLEALIKNGRLDIVYNAHAQRMDDIREIFFAGEELEPAEEEFLSALLTAIMPAMFQVWMDHPELGQEEPLDLLQRSLRTLEELFAS